MRIYMPIEALQFNIDASQRELDARNAEGEDVSHLIVCANTGAIVKRVAPTIHPLRAGAFASWDNPHPLKGF